MDVAGAEFGGDWAMQKFRAAVAKAKPRRDEVCILKEADRCDLRRSSVVDRMERPK